MSGIILEVLEKFSNFRINDPKENQTSPVIWRYSVKTYEVMVTGKHKKAMKSPNYCKISRISCFCEKFRKELSHTPGKVQ